jgi:hypothetical protein
MRSRGFERPGPWGIGALMLLLFHGLGMPRPAQAGCGHLVTSRSDRALDLRRLDALVSGDPSASPAGEPGRSPSGPSERGHRMPCSGPSCSNSTPAPASPTTFPQTDRFDQYGILNAVEALGAGQSGWIVDGPTPRPNGRPSSIFHPPPSGQPRP